MAGTETKTKKKSLLSMEIGGGKKKSDGGGNKSGGKSGGRSGRGKMPTKQSINLIIVDENKINPVKAIVLAAVIIVLAGAFSKFMVIDRLSAMSEATGRVSQLRSTLEMINAQIDSFGDLKEEYAHYSYSGMTDDELGLVDRTEVLKLADAVFAGGTSASTWRLSGNTLSAEVTGQTLEELNQLAQLLETSPIVDRCAITMANKTIDNDAAVDVTASIIVYLQQPAEEEGGEAS